MTAIFSLSVTLRANSTWCGHQKNKQTNIIYLLYSSLQFICLSSKTHVYLCTFNSSAYCGVTLDIVGNSFVFETLSFYLWLVHSNSSWIYLQKSESYHKRVRAYKNQRQFCHRSWRFASQIQWFCATALPVLRYICFLAAFHIFLWICISAFTRDLNIFMFTFTTTCKKWRCVEFIFLEFNSCSHVCTIRM